MTTSKPDKTAAAYHSIDGLAIGDKVRNWKGDIATVVKLRGGIVYLDVALELDADRELRLEKA